jgi:predicted NBD/HSP70 family sugar kinase
METFGWSRSLITRIAIILLDTGVLAETVIDSQGRGRGRPTVVLRLVVDSAATIGIDFGFKSVRMILARVDHQILASDERQLSENYGPEEAFTAVDEMLATRMQEHGVAWEDVVGAGIAISGPIDYPRNEPSLDSLRPFWSGDVVKRAAQHLHCPITLGNDTRLACYAELLWGSGRDFTDYLYLKLHSGTGGAFVANGSLVMGATGSAGEVGHMVIEPNGDRCRCGRRGCLETLVGVPALLKKLSLSKGFELSWADARVLINAKDEDASRVIDEVFEVIGRASASLCNVLNPQAVVLGGALSRAVTDSDIRVSRSIEQYALPSCAKTPVLVGSLGRDAAALGAVGAVLMRGII